MKPGQIRRSISLFFCEPQALALAMLISLSLATGAIAASNPTIDESTLRHAALGNLVSLSSELVPKWGRVRADLKATTSLDARDVQSPRIRSWNRWAQEINAKGNVDRGELAERIHRRLRRITYREDGAADIWQTPGETLAQMAGDCEDQAILGLSLALAAGVSPSEAGLAVGYDRYGRAHAILAIFDGDRILVVDINEPNVQEISGSGFSARMVTFVDQVWITRN